jgi:hypothetical protein
MMRTVLAALAIVALAEQTPGRLITLPLPHTPAAGDAVWLKITVGELERGTEVVVTTASGRIVGIISPYAVPSGRDAGIYTVPVPPDAIVKNRVKLRLAIDQGRRPRRAATLEEVKTVQVRITHPAR